MGLLRQELKVGTFTLANVSAAKRVLITFRRRLGQTKSSSSQLLRILQVTQELLLSTFVVYAPSGVAETANLTFAESYQTTYPRLGKYHCRYYRFYKLLSNWTSITRCKQFVSFKLITLTSLVTQMQRILNLKSEVNGTSVRREARSGVMSRRQSLLRVDILLMRSGYITETGEMI